MWEIWAKLIVAKGYKKLPKVQKIVWSHCCEVTSVFTKKNISTIIFMFVVLKIFSTTGSQTQDLDIEIFAVDGD